MDANSLRRVWRLNFEFRAVARRTSSCTRMLSRSSGPRAVPRPRPAIPRPRPAIPQLLPRLGLDGAARAGGGAARGGAASGLQLRWEDSGRGGTGWRFLRGGAKMCIRVKGRLNPTRLWEFGAPASAAPRRLGRTPARSSPPGFPAAARTELSSRVYWLCWNVRYRTRRAAVQGRLRESRDKLTKLAEADGCFMKEAARAADRRSRSSPDGADYAVDKQQVSTAAPRLVAATVVPALARPRAVAGRVAVAVPPVRPGRASEVAAASSGAVAGAVSGAVAGAVAGAVSGEMRGAVAGATRS